MSKSRFKCFFWLGCLLGAGTGDLRAVLITGGDWGGGNLIVAHGDILAGTFSNVGTFQVPLGVTAYVQAGVGLSLTAQLVDIDGVLSADGRGLAGGATSLISGATGAAGSGTGGGAGGGYGADVHASGGGGAGYGGVGGHSGQSLSSPAYAAGGPTYDSGGILMGSGGGSAGNHGTGYTGKGGGGGSGGGAVSLYADLILVSGTITADGINGLAGSADTVFGLSASGGGGGSGGGILLDGDLALSGLLSVDGGNGANFTLGTSPTGWGQGGGGGGGGRIKLLGRTAIGYSPTLSYIGGLGGSSHTYNLIASQSGVAGVFLDGTTGTFDFTAVPEPSTLLLLGVGAATAYRLHRRRRGSAPSDSAVSEDRTCAATHHRARRCRRSRRQFFDCG